MHDPLYPFLSKNEWNGILIEPQKNMLNKFQDRYKNRKNLLYYAFAVHPNYSKGKIVYYKKSLSIIHKQDGLLFYQISYLMKKRKTN